MSNTFDPIPSADGYRLSNPSVLCVISLLGSLNVFSKTSMADLVHKSHLLTGYLLHLLSLFPHSLKIITPLESRGCQVSILFPPGQMETVSAKLRAKGVIFDERKPDVIRIAPAPLYNSFEDISQFVRLLRDAIA